MAECDFWSIGIENDGIVRCYQIGGRRKVTGESLAKLYINRLHELDGTEAPPF